MIYFLFEKATVFDCKVTKDGVKKKKKKTPKNIQKNKIRIPQIKIKYQKFAITLATDNRIKLWDLISGEGHFTLKKISLSGVFGLKPILINDEQLLVCASNDGCLKFWQIWNSNCYSGASHNNRDCRSVKISNYPIVALCYDEQFHQFVVGDSSGSVWICRL